MVGTHSLLRKLSFTALAEVAQAISTPEKLEELLMSMISETDMAMTGSNFVLFKLIDLAKQERRYKFPLLFDKLLTMFKAFF